jgi:hypothetical protein
VAALVGLAFALFFLSFFLECVLARLLSFRRPVLHRCVGDMKVGSVHALGGISYAGGFFYWDPQPGYYRVVRVDPDDMPSDALFGERRSKILFCRLSKEDSAVYDVMTS